MVDDERSDQGMDQPEAEEAVAESEFEAEETNTPAVVDVLKDALADVRSERDEA